MAKTKVFVSYDHSEDAHYKRLLQAWDANSDFDFEFDSQGPNIAIDSTDAAVIKAAFGGGGLEVHNSGRCSRRRVQTMLAG